MRRAIGRMTKRNRTKYHRRARAAALRRLAETRAPVNGVAPSAVDAGAVGPPVIGAAMAPSGNGRPEIDEDRAA
jgi:hypothetical protein